MSGVWVRCAGVRVRVRVCLCAGTGGGGVHIVAGMKSLIAEHGWRLISLWR